MALKTSEQIKQLDIRFRLYPYQEDEAVKMKVEKEELEACGFLEKEAEPFMSYLGKLVFDESESQISPQARELDGPEENLLFLENQWHLSELPSVGDDEDKDEERGRMNRVIAEQDKDK